uniref:Secreted protein n=1 Tax=Anopheles culicifacies TaxID=139723 RepID=A0A182MI93_9DIPT
MQLGCFVVVLVWLTTSTTGRNYYGLGGIMKVNPSPRNPTHPPTPTHLQSKMMRNLRQSRHFHISPNAAVGPEIGHPADDGSDRKSRRHNDHQLVGDCRLYFI